MGKRLARRESRRYVAVPLSRRLIWRVRQDKVGCICTSHVTRTPTIHKIKAARNSVHIDNFTAEKETRTHFGLHGLHINLFESHTTGRY